MSNIVKEYNLIFTDVVKNNNKFWYGICLSDGTGYSEWGRVGGPKQRTDYPTHKVVEQKYNGKIKKGYEPLKTIKTGTLKTSQVSNLKEVAKKQIKFANPILGDLIERLVSFNIHNITSNTSITYDTNSGSFSTPLGLVVQEGIDDARKLLVTINTLIGKKDSTSDKIKDSINKYLKLIPQNLGFRKMEINNIFPNLDAVKKQNDILDSLEVSLNSVTKTTKKKVKEEKIFDAELEYLDKKDNEYLRLSKYYNDTNRNVHGYTSVKIENIYQVKIQSNLDKFKDIKPIVEVFHGTSGANCLSILKSGLRAVPPQTAAIAGAMFGPGVYGATDSSKSLQYTAGRFGGKNTGLCYMFICDFSMGNFDEIKSYGGRRKAGSDSIWAKAKNTGLRFDELIVPDDQVKIKYLLELK